MSNHYSRGWSLGYVSAVDDEGRTIWIADAHRDDGRRFVVHADEKLAAFIELDSAIGVSDQAPTKELGDAWLAVFVRFP